MNSKLLGTHLAILYWQHVICSNLYNKHFVSIAFTDFDFIYWVAQLFLKTTHET
jgi:hypothetical protein